MPPTLLLERLNLHERDEDIVFDEEPHIYYIKNKPVSISVTSLVHKYFGKFNADLIISRMMRGKNWESSKYYGMTADEIKQQWTNSGNEATYHGTIMHKAIECFYNNEPAESPEHVETVEYKQFEIFYKDHKDSLKAYRTEWVVYDEDIDLAGSIDMVFENTEDGTLSIYDWKRSKEIKTSNTYSKGIGVMSHLPDCNYIHYSLQLNIYKYILETKYDKIVRDMFLVVMHPLYKTYMKYEVMDLQQEVKTIMDERKEYLKNQHDIQAQ
tara:strand:+ start:19638 stop:20441 length:804 start_codon:yes stop_codon:yes gene_type:complete